MPTLHRAVFASHSALRSQWSLSVGSHSPHKKTPAKVTAFQLVFLNAWASGPYPGNHNNWFKIAKSCTWCVLELGPKDKVSDSVKKCILLEAFSWTFHPIVVNRFMK